MTIRPIIVVYINVSNIPPYQMQNTIDAFSESLQFIPKDEYISILFPNFERHEVVCLNPNIISEENYKELLGNIEEFQEKFNSIKNQISNESERKEF
jgi:hypothetical protein